MGEFATIDGNRVKIGTCESMYYATFDAYASAYLAGRVSQTDVPLKMACSGVVRFRFPFPDEDGAAIGSHDDFDRGYTFPVFGDSELAKYGEDHRKITHRIEAQGTLGYWHVLSHPCPAPTCGQGDVVPLQVVQQKACEDALWTVVRCGWCGAMWRLTPEAGAWAADAIRSAGSSELGQSIADRIEAGYKLSIRNTYQSCAQLS